MDARAVRYRSVLAALTAAAAAGAPCPGNAQLVTWQGHDSDASNVLKQLARLGLIRIQRRARQRRVQIVASGRWTGWTVARGERAPRRRTNAARDGEAGRLTAAEIAARRVERDACPRCAVRREVGCAHRPALRGLTSVGPLGLNHG